MRDFYNSDEFGLALMAVITGVLFLGGATIEGSIPPLHWLIMLGTTAVVVLVLIALRWAIFYLWRWHVQQREAAHKAKLQMLERAFKDELKRRFWAKEN
jgi:hypothetical protein